MGAGIAESAALAGMPAMLLDVSDDALERGRQTIEKDLERRVKKGRLSEEERQQVLGRVSMTTSIEDCAGAPLVVEAVVEDMEIKKKVFADLERVTGDYAVLATNTSSLSVAGIAAATEVPGRVVGACTSSTPSPRCASSRLSRGLPRTPRSSTAPRRSPNVWARRRSGSPTRRGSS